MLKNSVTFNRIQLFRVQVFNFEITTKSHSIWKATFLTYIFDRNALEFICHCIEIKIHLSTCLNMQHTLTSCRMALPYYYAAAANHSFNTKYCCCPYSVVLSVLVFVIDSIVIRLLFRLIPRVNTSRKPKYKWLCAFYHSALIQLHQFNGNKHHPPILFSFKLYYNTAPAIGIM